jgi:hypothetical protein
MYDSYKEKREVEIRQLSLKEQAGEGKNAHDQASDGVAYFTSDTVDQDRNPWTTEHRREGKGPHNNSYIRLGAAMGRDEEREEEKGGKAGNREEIGSGHEEKCGAIQHG